MSARRMLILLSGLAGCGGAGPTIDPIEDQVAAVGQDLVVELRASSDGGEIRFDFESSHPGLADRAELTTRPDGSAVWRFSPNAEDVGRFVVDFEAIDASGTTLESVSIDVRSAIGNATLPLFRRPLGSGTVLDMTRRDCIDLDIELTDQDSAEVVLSVADPIIEGGELLQETQLGGVWHWCPTAAQRAARDRYLLTIAASDGDNPDILKRFQIILRNQAKPACPGQAPIIAHAAADQTTVNDIELTAEVSDESSLKGAPLLYYATTAPTSPPDLATMTQVTMEAMGSVGRGGTFRALLPNPLPGRAPGSQETLHYALVVEDNDDPAGDCDHIATEVFQMSVTSPGGDGQLAACEPCSADAQCGDADDLCLGVGLEGARFCFQDCAAGCPDGFTCSPAELTSVDGARARQCVPLDERCEPAAAGCAADAAEPNDAQSAAQPIDDRALAARLCPLGEASEDDWFAIEVAKDAEVTVNLDSSAALDVDLALFDEAGYLIEYAEGTSSSEALTTCLGAGRYYVRIYSYFAGQADYTVRTSQQATSCDDEAWWGECWDDLDEDDDDLGSARLAEVDAPYRSELNQICADDDDWYQVFLFEGEILHGSLAFDLVGDTGDLDFRVHDDAGVLLTRCTEDDFSGCSANGQATGADEQIAFAATYTGTYYVVVHGWDGGENSYDLCLALDGESCAL